MAEPWQTVLNFWFGRPDAPDYGQPRKEWFRKSQAFDNAVAETLGPLYRKAIAAKFSTWRDAPESCLALILLFDQVPRNLFRGDPQAFATDPQALTLAKQVIAQKFDQDLWPIQRVFLYLPFEHSENLDDQYQSLALFRQLEKNTEMGSDFLEYAQRHFDVIQQFGRFPHRNQILGRTSTEAELDFLAQPGSSF
ncbi:MULTISPECIES: DUF924 family protein [Cyanophyceae]|uniref:DUF924 family protein n=1 Tax=Cyanophyceae TaxID=3028117 RepID=UPI00016DCBEA|nr:MULTISPECIES: DUF924 family protein [Cyanophyceae]ACB00042.1 conserved hypotheical protein (DUF924) [Picosynechococcus sp. PCC 7002]SMQ82819.1 Uncharacterized conserved protein, DUF924 family [Synechococcus sp. 7002]